MAIGGGGGGHNYNGGGSGYIAIGRKLLFSNSSVHVIVGGGRETSLVSVDGDNLIRAYGGRQALDSNGGDGYSGGGGAGGVAGGTNGRDGIDGTRYRGGRGNNFDISTVLMKNFVLTPGQGGQPEQSGCFQNIIEFLHILHNQQ